MFVLNPSNLFEHTQGKVDFCGDKPFLNEFVSLSVCSSRLFLRNFNPLFSHLTWDLGEFEKTFFVLSHTRNSKFLTFWELKIQDCLCSEISKFKISWAQNSKFLMFWELRIQNFLFSENLKFKISYDLRTQNSKLCSENSKFKICYVLRTQNSEFS